MTKVVADLMGGWASEGSGPLVVLAQAELALARARTHVGEDASDQDSVEAITDAVVALERAMLVQRLATEAGQADLHARATKIHADAGSLIDALTLE